MIFILVYRTNNNNIVSNHITFMIDVVLDPPDPPTDLSYDNTVIIESSVDLHTSVNNHYFQ